MTLSELIEIQKAFDAAHGWATPAATPKRIEMIAKDLIGLYGETGELANEFKKLQLRSNNGQASDREFKKRHGRLTEELVDSFIYLIRIAGHLEMNIESAYLKKLAKNKKKYRPLLKTRP